MHIRLAFLGYASAFGAGLSLTPGLLSGDGGRMLVTFLGLFSASILPTITLLVNGMTANGRSVNSILKLEGEISAALDALLFLFGCTAVTFAALMAISIQPPALFALVPYLTTDVLPRIGQGVIAMSVAAIMIRAGQIPAILRAALETRKQIAVQEARRKIAENAPDLEAVVTAFPTHPEFGKTIRIDERTS